MLGKNVGKMIQLATMIHVITEAEAGLEYGEEPGSGRVFNCIGTESVEMARRNLELFDKQKLIFLGEEDMLQLYSGEIPVTGRVRAAPAVAASKVLVSASLCVLCVLSFGRRPRPPLPGLRAYNWLEPFLFWEVRKLLHRTWYRYSCLRYDFGWGPLVVSLILLFCWDRNSLNPKVVVVDAIAVSDPLS